MTPTTVCVGLPGRVLPSSLHACERRVETRRGHSGAALLSRAAGRTGGRGDPGPDTDSGRTHSRWRRRDTLPAKAGRAAGYAGGRARASRARPTAPPRGGCGAQAGRGRGGGADVPAEGPSLHQQEGRWRSGGGLGSKATRPKPARSAPGRLSPGAGGRWPDGVTAAAPGTRPAQEGDGGWTAAALAPPSRSGVTLRSGSRRVSVSCASSAVRRRTLRSSASPRPPASRVVATAARQSRRHPLLRHLRLTASSGARACAGPTQSLRNYGPSPKAAIFLSQDSHRALPRRFPCPLLWGQGDVQAASSAGRPSPCKRGSLRCRGPRRGALQGSLPPSCGRGALSMGGGAAGGKAPSGHLLGPPGLRPFQAHGSDSAPPFPAMRPWPSE